MPFVSLAWGVLAFLVAVLLYSFRGFQATLIGANVPIQRKSSYAVLVPSIAIIVILLGSFGFLRMFRERHSWTSAV
jgi:hypothetical protein